MVKGGGDTDTPVWYQVTPDATGSYVNGTWTQLASMNVSRLFFGSDVLPSGNVFVVGGLYASDQAASTSAEIYNPGIEFSVDAGRQRSRCAGGQSTHRSPGKRQRDGEHLGPISGWGARRRNRNRYNPAIGQNKLEPGRQRNLHRPGQMPILGVKLPNGELLTYDGLTSSQDNQGLQVNFSRSVVDALAQSQVMAPCPFLRMPMRITGSDRSCCFPTDESSSAGKQRPSLRFTTREPACGRKAPTMPSVLVNGVSTQLTMNASPGAVMPNGDLLLALAPAVNGNSYAGPTFLYDFNPATGVYTNVTPPASSGFDTSNHSFVDNMLVLPTGQVLVTNFEGTPFIYTPQGTPNSAWKPSIISFTNNGNGSYTLSGTQLNGRDEGASDGGDGQMAENYPLVRVTDTLTGAVYYATTSNWSSTGVATGSATETVSVVLPTALGNDPYSLVVIADGIASSAYSGQNVNGEHGQAYRSGQSLRGASGAAVS